MNVILMPLEPLDIDEGIDDLVQESLNVEMSISDRAYYQFLKEQIKKKEKILSVYGFYPIPYNRDERLFTSELVEKWKKAEIDRRQTLLTYRQYIDPRIIQNYFDTFVYEIDFQNLKRFGYPVPQQIEKKLRNTLIPAKFLYDENFEKDEKLASERMLFNDASTNNMKFAITGVTVGELLNYFRNFTCTDSMIITKVLIVLRDGIMDINNAVNNVLEIEQFQKKYHIDYNSLIKLF